MQKNKTSAPRVRPVRSGGRSRKTRDTKSSPGLGAVVKGLWVFINSALGLLLVSSVLIAGLGKLYADYRADQADVVARRGEAIKLVTEVGLRGRTLLALELEPGDSSRVASERRTLEILRGVDEGAISSPEFKGLSVEALISRLDFLAGVTGVSPLGYIAMLTDYPTPKLASKAGAAIADYAYVRQACLTDGTLPIRRGSAVQEQAFKTKELRMLAEMEALKRVAVESVRQSVVKP